MAALSALWTGLALGALVFGVFLFGDLAHPLMWNDEAFTAVYAERVLEYGYPRVYGTRNVVYGLDVPLQVGVKEESGAYIGSPWGQYYFAALGAQLADRVSDLYTKTALLRLPFALAGAAGVGLFLLAALPLLGSDRRSKLGFALAFAWLCALSISLILHLREVRYYGLVVFFGGWIVLLVRRREIGGARSRALDDAALVLALLGLFASYYPASVAFGIGLALDAFWRVAASEGSVAWKARLLARRWLPLALAAGLALPAAVFLEIPAVAAALQAGLDNSLSAYAHNLTIVASNLLRFEFLGPVLVVKVLLGVLRWTGPAPADDGRVEPLRDFSFSLTLLGVVYWIVIARTPFIFERYFVVLGPLLITLLLVDATAAVRLLRARPSGAARVVAVLAPLALLAAVGVRAPELRGRVAELREPVRGPLDVTIPYLQQRYDAPENLVIATNYEDPAYVYYLGSHTIVGFKETVPEREVGLTPDVVVPRVWRKNQEHLQAFLRRASYRRTSFPVENSPTNNIPSLSRHTPVGIVHRFETRLASDRGPEVVVFERVTDREGG